MTTMADTQDRRGNRVFNSLLWAAVRVWGNRLGGLLVFFILARLLTPEDFGVYASLWALLLFLEVLSELGIGDALIQKEEIDQTLLNTAFFTSAGIAVAIYAAIWLLAPTFAALMDQPILSTPLRIAALAILFNALGYCQLALCRRNFQYRWLAVRTLLATLIGGIVGVTLAFTGYGYWALVWQYVLTALVGLLMLWVKPNWLPTRSLSLRSLRVLLPYSSKLTASRILENISTRGFELGITYFLGARTLGVYSVGSRITLIAMQLLSSVVLDVAHAGLSRIATDKERLRNAYLTGLKLSSTFAVPAFIVMAATAEQICTVVFGPQWADSGPILRLISLLAALQAVQYMNGAVLNATGHTGQTMLLSFLKAIAAAVSLLGFYSHGIEGLTIAFVLGQVLVTPISFYMSARHIDCSLAATLKALSPAAAASLICYLLLSYGGAHLPLHDGILKLLALAVLGMALYLGTLFALAPKQLLGLVSVIRHASKG
jgi:O-antigen/teichoic acid export membrane protein